jgi:phosphate transport system permease protein
MILPTIINISEVSIRAVPRDFKEGSLAIGATHWQTVVKVMIPAARSGIIASIVLGIGRAVGETMAVLMVAGNAPIMPTGLLSKVRTLTMNIITDMGYASGDHMTALFTTGIVLFVFIMFLNLIVNVITRKQIKREG